VFTPEHAESKGAAASRSQTKANKRPRKRVVEFGMRDSRLLEA
jgi:hypothetical protein